MKKTTTDGFKIESGIPIPGLKKDEPKKPKYPLGELKLTQSFFVPAKCAKYQSVAVAASLFKRRNKGFVFTAKKVVEKGVPGTRVWRIAPNGK